MDRRCSLFKERWQRGKRCNNNIKTTEEEEEDATFGVLASLCKMSVRCRPKRAFSTFLRVSLFVCKYVILIKRTKIVIPQATE